MGAWPDSSRMAWGRGLVAARGRSASHQERGEQVLGVKQLPYEHVEVDELALAPEVHLKRARPQQPHHDRMPAQRGHRLHRPPPRRPPCVAHEVQERAGVRGGEEEDAGPEDAADTEPHGQRAHASVAVALHVRDVLEQRDHDGEQEHEGGREQHGRAQRAEDGRPRDAARCYSRYSQRRGGEEDGEREAGQRAQRGLHVDVEAELDDQRAHREDARGREHRGLLPAHEGQLGGVEHAEQQADEQGGQQGRGAAEDADEDRGQRGGRHDGHAGCDAELAWGRASKWKGSGSGSRANEWEGSGSRAQGSGSW